MTFFNADTLNTSCDFDLDNFETLQDLVSGRWAPELNDEEDQDEVEY